LEEFSIVLKNGKYFQLLQLKKRKRKKKKKEEPPKKAGKKPKEDDDDEEENLAEKPQKNPLDSLPPSPFVFYDFKTLFVNAANKQEACDFLFKNFDPAGFSIWHVKYIKAEGEG